MKKYFLLLVITCFILSAFSGPQNSSQKSIIVFHAGSLSVPFREAAQEYQKRNPGVTVQLEAAGSLVCARKVTELKKPCDMVASADYFVINELLIPNYSSWGIRFATNQIIIAFSAKSRYSSIIDSTNWKDILLRKDVIFSRSDPNSDPCGYRSVFTMLLAEKYYKLPGLADRMLAKNREYIRPKEVDLVALMESNAIDYMFQYKSVAIQHNFKYIELPARISLSDPALNDYYKLASTEVTGSTPGSKMKVTGEYINYSFTVLENAPEKEEALKFAAFLLSPEGRNIFRKNGQDPILPASSDQAGKVPEILRKYLGK
ncbi:MAG TPA: extracellular solute-binding protein [Bacteroidales bacterium]|nr:extracellular solute-binding protein [Bacteroidales bacterium]